MADPFIISRSFKASRERLWLAWTNPEYMAQWSGPAGSTFELKDFHLHVDGHQHSHMVMPGGQEIWGKYVYREVVAPNRLVWLHSFADADGNIARNPWSADWPLEIFSELDFSDDGAGGTLMTLTWTPHNASPAEHAAFEEGKPGMTTGWTGSLNQLETFLAKPIEA